MTKKRSQVKNEDFKQQSVETFARFSTNTHAYTIKELARLSEASNCFLLPSSKMADLTATETTKNNSKRPRVTASKIWKPSHVQRWRKVCSK